MQFKGVTASWLDCLVYNYALCPHTFMSYKTHLSSSRL